MQVKMSDMDMRGFPGRTHRFLQVPVLYPFGHGLSYTTWNYSQLSSSVINQENGRVAIQASVLLKNTGESSRKAQCAALLVLKPCQGQSSIVLDCVKYYSMQREGTLIPFMTFGQRKTGWHIDACRPYWI